MAGVGPTGLPVGLQLIIVSDVFDKIPFLQRMAAVLKKIDFAKHVDVLCYSIREFEKLKGESSVLMDALQSGEQVA